MNTNTKSNNKETSQTQSESRKVVIEYMPFNETEAKVSKEQSKLELARNNLYESISKNETLVRAGGRINALTKIIKQDKEFKVITLRIGTKPIHKLVVDSKFKDLDVLADLKVKVKEGFFDEEIKDYCQQSPKKKRVSSSEKYKSPELSSQNSDAK